MKDDPLFSRHAKRKEWNSGPTTSVIEYTEKQSTMSRETLLKLIEGLADSVTKTKKALTDQRKYFILAVQRS